jgi:hypothetical protein
LAFSRDTALVIKAPTRQEEFKKVFVQARQSKEVADYLSAANLALRHGLLPEFRECCSEAYKLNPNDPTVVRLVEARRRIKRPLTDQVSAADALREIVRLPSMKIALSDHYVLLHDTGDAKQGRRRKSRAEQRLELLGPHQRPSQSASRRVWRPTRSW